jgi:hypothetical protein
MAKACKLVEITVEARPETPRRIAMSIATPAGEDRDRRRTPIGAVVMVGQGCKLADRDRLAIWFNGICVAQGARAIRP